MPYPLRLIDPNTPTQDIKPGDMWYVPWTINKLTKEGWEADVAAGKRAFMSAEYMRDWFGKRPPLMIRLPGGECWITDQCASDSPTSGWVITGEVPNLTAMPSIKSMHYHGWLKDGVLSDDLGGRTYDI